jgi:integrase
VKSVRRPVGRPRRFARFEEFEAGLPRTTGKRPTYCDGIGIYRGAKDATVWIKVRLPRGGSYKGRSIPPGGSIEHKLGRRASWEWESLVRERDHLQGLADRGEPLEPREVPTFAQYSQQWLDRKEPSLRSFGVTRGNVNAALNPTFGKSAINAITVNDVNNWIAQQLRELKPSSVQRQLNTFKAVMNDAIRNGLIDRSPSDNSDKIRGIEARGRFVTADEWKVILETAEAIEVKQEAQKESRPHQIRGWLKLFVQWAYESGMRRAEIHNLTWHNIRALGELTVVEVVNTKTDRPRFVTCTEEMEDILSKLKELDRDEGDDRLFPVSMTTLKRSLARLWKATGLSDVRLHDLRRTHATILIHNNVDPRTVAGRLGHSGTSMLARHYAVDRGDAEAAKAFGRPSKH